MNVSIVIPAYNEESRLPTCLQALTNQKTQHNFQIIIVDNASIDETTIVAKQWQEKLNLKVISESQRGRGAARAKGFANAMSDIILSTDADSVVPPDWVEVFVNTLLKNAGAVAVTSPSYITDGTKLTNWTMRVGMPFSLRVYRLLIGHYMVTGGSFAVRREAYEKAGGFDVTRDMLDDVDLSFRLSQLGRIMYLPKLCVETEGDIFGKGFLRGFLHYFRHFPAILKSHKFKSASKG